MQTVVGTVRVIGNRVEHILAPVQGRHCTKFTVGSSDWGANDQVKLYSDVCSGREHRILAHKHKKEERRTKDVAQLKFPRRVRPTNVTSISFSCYF
jgi:hypothetical protein